MALHIKNEALQQIRPAQEGRVRGRRAAERDVISAAGACVAPVHHEFVGAEPRLPRFFVKRRRDLDRLLPACRGLDIDFDDAGIGRHFDHIETRIMRRRIAFDPNGQARRFRGRFERREKFNNLQVSRRRHESVEHAVARLERHRRSHARCAFGLIEDGLALRRGIETIELRELLRIGSGARSSIVSCGTMNG